MFISFRYCVSSTRSGIIMGLVHCRIPSTQKDISHSLSTQYITGEWVGEWMNASIHFEILWRVAFWWDFLNRNSQGMFKITSHHHVIINNPQNLSRNKSSFFTCHHSTLVIITPRGTVDKASKNLSREKRNTFSIFISLLFYPASSNRLEMAKVNHKAYFPLPNASHCFQKI